MDTVAVVQAVVVVGYSVGLQYSPVIAQPPGGLQTVAPVPRSAQRRVQQLDDPVHGAPDWPQPPVTALQYPGVPFGVVKLLEQRPEQQSWFR